MRLYRKLKYKFEWMRVFFSPFKSPIPIFYMGKIAIGTPYMLPRVWRKSKDGKYMTHSPRKFGFDFVPLGYKWKYEDLRHEWNPVWSFVIWKLQIALVWHLDPRVWESYLTYINTPKERNVFYRLLASRRRNRNVWVTSEGKEDWFVKGLRKKWSKIFNDDDW